MNKHYQSDLDEDEPEDQPFELIENFDKWMAIIALVAALLWAGISLSDDKTGDGPCVPTVSDYDSAYAFGDGDFVVIWWCPEQDSMRAYWWTDTLAKSNPATVLRLAGRDPEEFKQQLSRRWSTVEQITLAMQTQAEQGPRFYADKTPVSCLSWRMVDGKRMCEVSGQIRADGSRVPADSWASCELAKAPSGGWE